MKKNILLIFGGVSFEHEISCKSAYAIYSALTQLESYTVLSAYIDKYTGTWYFQESVPENPDFINKNNDNIISIVPGNGFFLKDLNLKVDVVFPMVHGRTGEDGGLQGLLKVLDIPYVGAGILGSAISSNKYFCKILLESFNIPIVPYFGFTQYSYKLDTEGIKEKIETKLGYPVIIKPVTLGSSIGINIAYNKNQIDGYIEEAFKYDLTVLVEKFLKVREIECSVVGNEQVKVFTPGEIVIQNFMFYDYDAKYSTLPGSSVIFNIPAQLDNKDFLDIKEYAFIAYKNLELRGFARIDFFIEKKTGKIYLNEINTIPGFTDVSLFSKMCEHDGLAYKNLVEKLVSLAFQSYSKRKKRIDFESLED